MSLAARRARREKIGTGMAQAWPGNPMGRRAGMSSWEVTVVRHPLAGYLVRAGLFGALFAWEGLGSARSSLAAKCVLIARSLALAVRPACLYLAGPDPAVPGPGGAHRHGGAGVRSGSQPYR